MRILQKGMLFMIVPLSLVVGWLISSGHAVESTSLLLFQKDTLILGNYPKDYFGSPLEVPLYLSGNFGELRTNHFHAGIDIKTEQREGLNVLASADGYVSRIKVSPVGYGYALYIDHPNGFTTVYGHLQRYNDKILAFVKAEQYKQKLFSVDLFPAPGDLPVLKGEKIGLSGNSGGSGGPHLHFEIRETATEKTLNPLLFGFNIKDKIAPSINGIWIIPMNDSAWVNAARLPVSFIAAGSTAKLGIKSAAVPTVYGDIAFAIHTSDMLDGNTNRCGIYRIELFVDGLQVYGQRMDRLDFTTNRAMNAHTLYERFKKDRSQIHGSYRLPGNPLDIYDNLVNDGIVSFKDGKLHEIKYIVEDIEGNRNEVNFKVQSQSSPKAPPQTKKYLAHFDWEKENEFDMGEVRVKIPAYAMYEDLDLNIEKREKMAGFITPTYLVASPYEPIHEKFTICIKADKLVEKYQSKAVVVRYDPDKDKVTSEGGYYENGFVCASPMYLGYFGVKIDTISPTITNTDFAVNLKGRSQFSFRVSDGLSGVDQIIPNIDGEWALMEYDAKNNRITYYFDPVYIQKGKHTFELRVLDAVGNEKKYSSNFEW